MPTDLAKTDLDLIIAEESLHQLLDLRKSLGEDPSPVLSAHAVIAKEMASRGLIYTPMDKAEKKVADDMDHSVTGDVDQGSDDDDSESHGGTEQQEQKKRSAIHDKDGPVVRKFGATVEGDSNSGAPPSFTHPADNPMQPKGGKHGKGGEKNRTQDDAHPDDSVDGDTDDKNPGHGVNSYPAPKKKANGPDSNTVRGLNKDAGWDPLGTDEDYAEAVMKGAAAPHAFWPVRDVCRTCKNPTAAHGAGGDHDFAPVRNICRTCKGGQDMHKAVALSPVIKQVIEATEDDEDRYWKFFKALPQLSTEQRQSMAEQGIALPDGSFPIPDEAHLHAAIRLVGQAQDPQSAMNHIIERAHAMGMSEALPPAWNVSEDPSQAIVPVQPGAHSQGIPADPAMAGNAKPAGPGGSAGMPAAPQPGGGAQATGGTAAANPAGMAGVGAAPQKPDAGMVPPTDPNKPKKPAGAGGATPLSGSGPNKPGLMKRLAKAFVNETGPSSSVTADVELDSSFDYAVIKTAAPVEERYTLGPVYMPGQLDAHSEWASAEDLQKSTWQFVEDAFAKADRSVYLQHSDQPAGEWVEIMALPVEINASMQKSVDGVQKSVTTTFPAGTVYMGVKWQPWAYEMVKSGKITGFSMGGWAQRVEGLPG